jgi:hypothetical protein
MIEEYISTGVVLLTIFFKEELLLMIKRIKNKYSNTIQKDKFYTLKSRQTGEALEIQVLKESIFWRKGVRVRFIKDNSTMNIDFEDLKYYEFINK